MKFYRGLIQQLKKTGVYSWVIKQRVKRAGKFLEYANIYPEARDEILEDFRYSILKDFRDLFQVLNLEECIRHVTQRSMAGAFVETGVFTGGASAYALRALLRHGKGRPARPYWGFDSFQGMPQPTVQDGDRAVRWMFGRGLKEIDPSKVAGKLEPSEINASDYEECLAYLHATGYPREEIHLIKGWFEDTLPVTKGKIGPIAILRLDGDFYQSTKVVLENLYDQVVPNGIIIIDDYGSFEGCRRAIDEFLAARSVAPFIHYVENGVRFFVKP